MIRVSANGHLVVTTIHGSDIISGLKRLIELAVGDAIGNKSDDLRKMLASSLKLCLHQQLISVPSNKQYEQSKFLNLTFLLSNGPSSRCGNSLSSNKIEYLPNIIERQRTLLQTKGVNELLKEEGFIS